MQLTFTLIYLFKDPLFYDSQFVSEMYLANFISIIVSISMFASLKHFILMIEYVLNFLLVLACI